MRGVEDEFETAIVLGRGGGMRDKIDRWIVSEMDKVLFSSGTFHLFLSFYLIQLSLSLCFLVTFELT